MSLGYLDEQPTRDEVDALPGATIVEFGQNWCGICRGATPTIDAVLEAHPQVRRIKVADGPGLPLGRSFKVKLWPTLVLMRDGAEIGRAVRPNSAEEIEALLSNEG